MIKKLLLFGQLSISLLGVLTSLVRLGDSKSSLTLRQVLDLIVLSLLIVVATSVVVEAGPIKKHPRPIPESYIVVLNPDQVRADDDEFSWLPSVSEIAQEMVEMQILKQKKVKVI